MNKLEKNKNKLLEKYQSLFIKKTGFTGTLLNNYTKNLITFGEKNYGKNFTDDMLKENNENSIMWIMDEFKKQGGLITSNNYHPQTEDDILEGWVETEKNINTNPSLTKEKKQQLRNSIWEQFDNYVENQNQEEALKGYEILEKEINKNPNLTENQKTNLKEKITEDLDKQLENKQTKQMPKITSQDGYKIVEDLINNQNWKEEEKQNWLDTLNQDKEKQVQNQKGYEILEKEINQNPNLTENQKNELKEIAKQNINNTKQMPEITNQNGYQIVEDLINNQNWKEEDKQKWLETINQDKEKQNKQTEKKQELLTTLNNIKDQKQEIENKEEIQNPEKVQNKDKTQELSINKPQPLPNYGKKAIRKAAPKTLIEKYKEKWKNTTFKKKLLIGAIAMGAVIGVGIITATAISQMITTQSFDAEQVIQTTNLIKANLNTAVDWNGIAQGTEVHTTLNDALNNINTQISNQYMQVDHMEAVNKAGEIINLDGKSAEQINQILSADDYGIRGSLNGEYMGWFDEETIKEAINQGKRL